jgi:hypothetical protein
MIIIWRLFLMKAYPDFKSFIFPESVQNCFVLSQDSQSFIFLNSLFRLPAVSRTVLSGGRPWPSIIYSGFFLFKFQAFPVVSKPLQPRPD